MDAYRVGRLHRALRRRLQLTQEDVARRAGVARWKIVRLEAADVASLRLGDVDRCFAALDARLDVRVWYHGAAVDRLLDEGHARLVGLVADLLRAYGWQVHVEVTFSEYGERGSIDLLAWHAGARVLLVAEMKTELGSIEGTLRPFDAKCRLAIKLAGERFGWQPVALGRMLVLPEERSVRRAVERHASLLYGALPAHSRALRSWVTKPVGNIAGIWFLSDGQPANVTRNPSSIRRVRRRRPRSAAAP